MQELKMLFLFIILILMHEEQTQHLQIKFNLILLIYNMHKNFFKGKKSMRAAFLQKNHSQKRKTEPDRLFKYDLQQIKPPTFQRAKMLKPSTAPYRTYRSVSLSNQLKKFGVVTKEQLYDLEEQGQALTNYQYSQFKGSPNLRNQLKYLKPHCKFMDKSLSIQTMKEQLYKGFISVDKIQSQTSHRSQIIQYMTEYDSNSKQNPQTFRDKKSIETNQQSFRNQLFPIRIIKNPPINVLREKIRQKRKYNSKYFSKISKIKDDHIRLSTDQYENSLEENYENL